MQKIIRIGTRESQLALWQANKVRKELDALGYETEIVPIKSTGDIVLDKPLYELGITGIFTKNLDIALLFQDEAESYFESAREAIVDHILANRWDKRKLHELVKKIQFLDLDELPKNI